MESRLILGMECAGIGCTSRLALLLMRYAVRLIAAIWIGGKIEVAPWMSRCLEVEVEDGTKAGWEIEDASAGRGV